MTQPRMELSGRLEPSVGANTRVLSGMYLFTVFVRLLSVPGTLSVSVPDDSEVTFPHFQVLRGGDPPAGVELLVGHRVCDRPLSCQAATTARLEGALQDSEERAFEDVCLPCFSYGLPS